MELDLRGAAVVTLIVVIAVVVALVGTLGVVLRRRDHREVIDDPTTPATSTRYPIDIAKVDTDFGVRHAETRANQQGYNRP